MVVYYYTNREGRAVTLATHGLLYSGKLSREKLSQIGKSDQFAEKTFVEC